MDSRDLNERLEELKQEQEDLREDKQHLEEAEAEELKQLQDLKDECENYGWDCGIFFIPESDFKDYCRELAEDCGYIDRRESNPLMSCINWDEWAELCEQDYQEIEFQGDTYLWREA